MDIEKKLKKFSDLVYDEARKEQHDILEKVSNEYKTTCNDFYSTNKRKYNQLFEEERGRFIRENQKDIVTAQTEMKRELIAIRKSQENIIFNNVRKRIEEYMQSDEYLNRLISEINDNKVADHSPIVYLVKKDMKHKKIIEKNTGVTCIESTEDFIGGFKITISNNRILDRSFESRMNEAERNFNKIKIL